MDVGFLEKSHEKLYIRQERSHIQGWRVDSAPGIILVIAIVFPIAVCTIGLTRSAVNRLARLKRRLVQTGTALWLEGIVTPSWPPHSSPALTLLSPVVIA